MKGLVLAGGSGTRLRPITSTGAKQLVPVANKPVLYYVLESLAAVGITDVLVVVGSTEPEVREAVGDGRRFGLDVRYLRQAEPLGLAHCVRIARDALGDDEFVMYLGDNLLLSGITDFVAAYREACTAARATGDDPPAAQILLARVPDPQRFGVAELGDDGRVLRLVEKPRQPPSDFALVGVYLFDRRIHEAVAAITPSARGEYEITDAIQWLIARGHRVDSQVVGGYWKDLGEKDALLEGNRLVLERVERRIDGAVDAESRVEGRVVVEAGAEVVRSVVRGPAVLAAGTRVVDSFVGPFTAIDEGCRVERSEIEHSIVMKRVALVDAGRLVDCLIGNDVSVCRATERPQALRLMLGDHSRVELQ